MRYPIVIHKEKNSDYGVTVPDLPGCFSAGSTLDEAIAMARQAIELHLEGLIEESLQIPEQQTIEAHQENEDFGGGIWAVVEVDLDNLRMKAKRINITVPERLLESIDRCAKGTGDTRSGFLVKAAMDRVSLKSKSDSSHVAVSRHTIAPSGTTGSDGVKERGRSAGKAARAAQKR